MPKYLIFSGKTAAIVEVPIGFTSDQYGDLQDRYSAKYGDERGGSSMRRLTWDCCYEGVWYDWELAGPDGASFEVFQFPNTPAGSVTATVKHLKVSRDVVRLVVKRFVAVADEHFMTELMADIIAGNQQMV